MANFDFIGNQDFRNSLDADYAEMRAGLQNGLWKSVQVIAGSIVETLLVDYLVSTTVLGRKSGDPLRWELAEVVEICKKEHVISERTADLCSVVRSYRNLIHPGRTVRMREELPNEDTARVASTLVHMIAKEVGASRTEKLGYTAEQVAAKICNDENALSILKHLLEETNEPQKLQLLADTIPRLQLEAIEEDRPRVANRLKRAFRSAFDAASDPTQDKIAGDFITKLKEADTLHVDWYSRAFLFRSFVPHLKDARRTVLLDYMFGRLDGSEPKELRDFYEIGALLQAADAERILDPYARGLPRKVSNEEYVELLVTELDSLMGHTKPLFDNALKARLNHWLEVFKGANRESTRTVILKMLANAEAYL